MTHYRVEQSFSSATPIGAPSKGSLVLCEESCAAPFVRLGWLTPVDCKPKTPAADKTHGPPPHAAEKKPRKPRTVKPKD